MRTAATGSEALSQVAAATPALIVLDLMLPDIDGIEVCKRIRQRSDVPILMLTARDEDVDKIIGLEVGADDYLTKPFNPRELVARVKSILRRATPERRERESETLEHGDLRIDAGRREVRVGDDEIQLAPKEFDLLWELLDHRGLVLTRDQLLERVWGYTFAGDTRTVDVHVRQLRRKLGDASPIVTVWGVGYKVSPAKDATQGHHEGRRLGMLGSLRVRLPLIFLAGLVLAGLVTTAISVQLFDQFAHDQTRRAADARGERHRRALLRRDPERVRQKNKRGQSTDRLPPTVRGQEPRARDRRPDLLGRAAESVPGPDLRPAAAAVQDDRLDVRQAAHVRVHAAGAATAAISRSRARCGAGRHASARSSSRRRRPTSAIASIALL